MSVALVSIAIVTKSVGASTQKHVYAVSLASRPDKEPLQRKASFDGRGLGDLGSPSTGSYRFYDKYDPYDYPYYKYEDDSDAEIEPSSDEPDEPEDD